MKRTRIIGLGRGVGANVLTNADLEKMVDTSDDWISERTGIKQRHIANNKQITSDLAAEAAQNALKMAGVKAEELDAIILGTVTPDMPMPATATFVQKKIGANKCPAFDISAACAGFLFGLQIADGFFAAGRAKKILVVGVELLSRVLDWTDRNTCVLFGDASGAAVLISEEGERGILDLEIHSDGTYAPDLDIRGGGSANPTSAKTIEEKMHFVRMNGKQIFTQAVRNMSAASQTLLERNGLTENDIKTVFAHQANMRILEGVSQRTKLPMDKFFINIQRYGNTSSASIPIAMSEAYEEGRIKEGDLLLLTALGAGISWGSALVRW